MDYTQPLYITLFHPYYPDYVKDIFLSWFWQPNNVLATFILTFDSKSYSWITNFAPVSQNFSKMNTSSAPDSAETKKKLEMLQKKVLTY